MAIENTVFSYFLPAFVNCKELFDCRLPGVFTNSVDPDEMQQHAAFHLGLHCLQKYLFIMFI